MKSNIEIGQKCGRLLVVERLKNDKRTLWKCLCDCGNVINTFGYNLSRPIGGTKSCGCLLKEKVTKHGRGLIDITGNIYGRLKVIGNLGHRRNNRILWTCLCQCGTIKRYLKQPLISGRTVSCSCHKNDIARSRSGPNHPSWKGGVLSGNAKDRNCQETNVWRKAVFERDHFCCLKCKKNSNRLHAHHIFSFCDNKDLRFEVSNGLTLCLSCHASFHRKYGKGGNNRQQLEEYLNA